MTLRVKACPRLLDVNRIPGQSKKRKKISLEFDEKKRRDFLLGFRKRKAQRRQKAQEDLKIKLKEERKRIKSTVRERYKKLLSSRDIPELKELLSEQQYETEGHTVSILELNVSDFAEETALIGTNNGNNEENEEEPQNENENSFVSDEEIVGMSLHGKKNVQSSKPIKIDKQIETRKELKQITKKAALHEIKKSKAYQRKQRWEQLKNKKESRRKLKKIKKIQERSGKLKKKSKH